MNPFETFYETWLNQLKHIVQEELYKVHTPPTTAEQNRHLRRLTSKVMAHYTEYYRVKGLAADRDILSLFAAPWSTSLERALHWIAGWRPTTIFHLIYTESSLNFESHIIDILLGYRTGDLRELTPAQYSLVNELQCNTVAEENGIAAEMTQWQDGAAELLSEDAEDRLRRLSEIVKKADELRLRTVRKVVEMLTPQQAVEFIVVASEFVFGIHSWGIDEDSRRMGN